MQYARPERPLSDINEGGHMKIEVYKKLLLWRVKLVGKNGEVLLHSEAYYNKSNADRAAKKLKKEIK